MPLFEVLLISIDWESPNRVRTIIPSKKYVPYLNPTAFFMFNV